MRIQMSIFGIHSWANGLLFWQSFCTYISSSVMPVLSSSSFRFSGSTSQSVINLEIVLVKRVWYVFCMRTSVFTPLFLEASFFWCILLVSLSSSKCLKLCVLMFGSLVLFHRPPCLFVKTSYCFHYCGYVIYPKVWNSSSIFSTQDCSGCQCPLWFHMKFRVVVFYFSEEQNADFIGIALNLYLVEWLFLQC